MIRGTDYRGVTSNGQTRLVDGMALVEAELNLLFNIQKYSLFMGNNIGIDLDKYLSLKNKAAIFNLVRTEIEELFSKYKSSVQLNRLEITFDDASSTLSINLDVASSGRTKAFAFTVGN